MGLFTWLTGQPEPTKEQQNVNTEEMEFQNAKINTPYEYRNCMNCKWLNESGGTFYCYHNYLNTQKREEIAGSPCNTHAWEPRKLGGSYKNYVFSPDEWYQE